MSAVVISMPIKRESVSRLRVHKPPKEIVRKDVNIEDLKSVMSKDILFNLSGVFSRVGARFNDYLDEGAKVDTLDVKKVSNGNAVYSLAEFQRLKDDSKITKLFQAVAETRKIRTEDGLEKFMTFARSYGGAGSPDYEVAQDYVFVQKLFADEFAKFGIRDIRVV